MLCPDRRRPRGGSLKKWLSVAAVMAAAVTSVHAQMLDATQFQGADACVKINAAITAASGGVVDARGFFGAQTCSVNMFPSNAIGKLLLGNVAFNIIATQVQPPKFQVEGIGWTVATATPTNTAIVACAGAGPNCASALPNSTGGLNGMGPLVWCYGGGGACSNAGNPTISFGSLTQYMTFDCNGLANCTAYQAFYVQEGSGCWHCQFQGWGNGSLGADICNANGQCQNSSYFDLFATINGSSANTCLATAIPIRMNTGGQSPGPKFIKKVTVDAQHCSTAMGNAPPYDSMRVSTFYTSIEDVLVEQGTVVGLRLAGDGNTAGVTVMNVTSASPTTSPPTGFNQCGNPSTTTVAVLVDNVGFVRSTTIISNGTPGTTVVPTNILVDCFNTNTISRTSDPNIAAYVLDQSGLVSLTTSGSIGPLMGHLSVGSVAASAYSFQIANNGTTATVVNKLAILTGAPSTATVATVGSTTGVVGLVVAGAGTTGNATIEFAGTATCVFDATAITAGHYVQASTVLLTAGDCHDAGAAKPATNQIIGRALTSGAASTSQTILLMMTQ